MDERVKPNAGLRKAREKRRHGYEAGCRGAARPGCVLRDGSVKRAPKINLGGLDQFTGYVVRRAQVWIFQDFKRALKELDMTPAQFSVMKIVAANPGIAQARVAEVLCIERARLVQMLDRLEAPRLIDRDALGDRPAFARAASHSRGRADARTPRGADRGARAQCRGPHRARRVRAICCACWRRSCGSMRIADRLRGGRTVGGCANDASYCRIARGSW